MSVRSGVLGRRRFLGVGAVGALVPLLAACGAPIAPTAAPTQPATGAGTTAPAAGAATSASTAATAVATSVPARAAAAATSAPAGTAAAPAGATKPAAAPAGATKPAAAPAAAAPAASGQKVTLRFWTYYEPASRAKDFPDLLKTYQDANPGVTVELNAGFQNFATVTQTAIVGGDPPELLGCTQYLMREFVKQNLLSDLTEPIKSSGADKNFYPAAMEGTSLNGKIWALTDALRYGIWFYNPKPFQELGLKIPTSYADLVALSGPVKKAGKYLLLFGQKDLTGSRSLISYVFTLLVGTNAIAKASDAKDYLSNPKFVEALAYVGKMRDDNILDQADTGIGVTDMLAMLGRGETLTYPAADVIANVINLKAGIQAMPQQPKMVEAAVAPEWGGIGQTYTIPKANKYLEPTLKLFQWWMQPDQIRVQVEKAGLISSQPEANKAVSDPLAKVAVENMAKVTADGQFFTNFVPPGESDAWAKATQEVMTKQKTPQEAIKTVQAAVK